MGYVIKDKMHTPKEGGNNMAYSKLCKKIIESPNHSGKRTEKINIITPHIIVGLATMNTLGEIFSRPARQASSNYGVCTDGIVGIVDEDNRSWCSSSNWNDQKAITIEVACENFYPYKVPQEYFEDLVDLCVDICRRHGFKRMINTSSKEDLEAKLKSKSEDTILLSKHNYFANTSCPGADLSSRFDELAKLVNEQLGEAVENEIEVNQEVKKMYRVQVGAYTVKQNAENMKEKLIAAGFDAIIKEEVINETVKVETPVSKPVQKPKKSNEEVALEVIRGTWGNGAVRKQRLEAAGYNYSDIQGLVNKMLAK